MKRLLIQLGLVWLFLGSLMFVGHSVLGIMVDVLQGVLYIASGMCAFAAVMVGTTAMRRFVLSAGLVYAVIFFAGVVNHGYVLRLFRTDPLENIIHLLFAGTLLALTVKEQAITQWLEATKRTT